MSKGYDYTGFLNDELTWKKSTRSGPSSDDCVEVAPLPNGGVALRDSKNPSGPRLEFTPSEWDAFSAGVKDGEFDEYGRPSTVVA